MIPQRLNKQQATESVTPLFVPIKQEETVFKMVTWENGWFEAGPTFWKECTCQTNMSQIRQLQVSGQKLNETMNSLNSSIAIQGSHQQTFYTQS